MAWWRAITHLASNLPYWLEDREGRGNRQVGAVQGQWWSQSGIPGTTFAPHWPSWCFNIPPLTSQYAAVIQPTGGQVSWQHLTRPFTTEPGHSSGPSLHGGTWIFWGGGGTDQDGGIGGFCSTHSQLWDASRVYLVLHDYGYLHETTGRLGRTHRNPHLNSPRGAGILMEVSETVKFSNFSVLWFLSFFLGNKHDVS